MEFDCLSCGATVVLEEAPFGDDVVCPKCGAVHETDMEESYDSLSFWVVDLRATPTTEGE